MLQPVFIQTVIRWEKNMEYGITILTDPNLPWSQFFSLLCPVVSELSVHE